MSNLNGLRRWGLCVGAAWLLGLCGVLGAGERVFHIEEDWELVVESADSDSVAPQITTAWSPLGNAEGVFATLELNHQTLPEFTAGGMQLLLWNGEHNLAQRKITQGDTLRPEGDSLRWTQVLSLVGNELTFRVKDGESTTWGKFGEGLVYTVRTSLNDLNDYSPSVSVKNSGVGFASNRVKMLAIKRVRLVTEQGEELTDETVHYVHQK